MPENIDAFYIAKNALEELELYKELLPNALQFEQKRYLIADALDKKAKDYPMSNSEAILISMAIAIRSINKKSYF